MFAICSHFCTLLTTPAQPCHLRAMPKKRLLLEFGRGSSLRRQDYTQAAHRALQDALWHNSINLAKLFGFPKESMLIDVEIGVQDPQSVDLDALKKIFPYGQVTIKAVKGGLDIPRNDGGNPTVSAIAAIAVSFDMEPAP